MRPGRQGAGVRHRARAEAGEAAAAVEIAVLSGDADEENLERVVCIANRQIAMLTGLIRR